MYQRILIGYLDTDQGRDALELGTLLARANRAELIFATARTEEGESLAQLARHQNADLVVLGSSHRGPVGRVFPGATVEHLLDEAPCAVAVAPPGFGLHADGDCGWRPLSSDAEDVGLRVIGVGFDGTGASTEALKTAAELAVPNGAALRVYTVAHKHAPVPGGDGYSSGPGGPTEAEALREKLHEAVAGLPPEARAQPVFLRGFAAQKLVEASAAGVDLLVLGSRGGGPVRRWLRQSVTSTVMQDAKCALLITPTGVEAPVATLA